MQQLRFSAPFKSGKWAFLVLSSCLVLLIVENVDSYIADFLVKFNISIGGITLFFVISAGFIFVQFFLLNLIKRRGKNISARSSLVAGFQRLILLTQYLLTANVLAVLFQIVAFSEYSISSLVLATLVSNSISALLFIIFGMRFVSWYRNAERNVVILLFASSFLILGFLNFMAGAGDSYLLLEKDNIINASSIVQYRDFSEGSFFNRFYDYYDYLDYVSFLLLLVAAGSMLYHYGKTINRSKLILILALPILSYTSSILDALNLYDTDTAPELFTYYIFQSLTTISGGVLFAISFWYVARMLPNSPVKTFLKITACGFVFLSVANHVSVSLASYPPFGINSLSLLPLSSYALLFGLYSSALSLSQDRTLRQLIRRLARSDENLLSSIGTAQMGLEVSSAVNKLKNVVEKEGRMLEEISGINSPIEEQKIEEYVKQVLEEVKKARKHGKL